MPKDVPWTASRVAYEALAIFFFTVPGLTNVSLSFLPSHMPARIHLYIPLPLRWQTSARTPSTPRHSA